MTLCAACVGFLVVALVAENLAWLADLKVVVQRTPSRFPSSQVVPPRELARGVPVMSVYTETSFLRDPQHGLLTNPTRVGREWEHPATVSYFDGGELLFASNIGLRVHGGKSRTGSPVKSFRLYFRRDYGSARFRPGTLFDGKGDPLTRLVAHNDLRVDGRGVWWHLVNPLAFDIVRQIGGLAPETQPASFVLNGVPQGLYVLVEHVREPFLMSRFGHENFDRADERRRRRWMRQVTKRPSVTQAELSTWLDVESLSRWFVSIVFCATTDPFQAVMFLDETQREARWFWVNWDMDHSFMDLYRSTGAPWRHDTFRTTLRSSAFEARLLRRLIADDPAYRDYLAGMFLDALNYQLTPAFLEERFRHYQSIVEAHGMEDDAYLDRLAEFFEERPSHVRKLLGEYLSLDSLHQVQVEGPAGASFQVNGHVVPHGFSGWYLEGTDIWVEFAAVPEGFSHWSVNGRRVPYHSVLHRVRRDVVIRAEVGAA